MRRRRGIRPMIVVDGRAVFDDDDLASLPAFSVSMPHYRQGTGGGFTTAGGRSLSEARAHALKMTEAPWHAGPYAVIRDKSGRELETIGPWERWPVPRCMSGFGGMTDTWRAERHAVAARVAEWLGTPDPARAEAVA